jgi:hypothetical protein
MYYAKQIDENGNIIALHTMDRPFAHTAEFVPITEEEYLELMAEMPDPEPTDEISDSEALAIIMGGAV